MKGLDGSIHEISRKHLQASVLVFSSPERKSCQPLLPSLLGALERKYSLNSKPRNHVVNISSTVAAFFPSFEVSYWSPLYLHTR